MARLTINGKTSEVNVDPSTSWPATCRKYGRISRRKANMRQPYVISRTPTRA